MFKHIVVFNPRPNAGSAKWMSSTTPLNFVPQSQPHTDAEIRELRSFVRNSDRMLVLTGAGASTESGIPDYRSEGVGLYARSSTRPVQFQQFMTDAEVRRRYWARNFAGWPRFSSVGPNATHRALARIPNTSCLVTQNVDRLHHKAGSSRVVELHGTAFRVVCMSCKASVCRHRLQRDILRDNPELSATSAEVRPDGDVELPMKMLEQFKAPLCASCGGILKPDIVFFGDNVPRTLVDDVYREVRRSDALLVIGSSLQVFSGYRFILEAKERNIPIAIVNIGPTRADHLATIKICRRSGAILEKLVSLL